MTSAMNSGRGECLTRADSTPPPTPMISSLHSPTPPPDRAPCDRADGRSERAQIVSARIVRRLAGPALLSAALASLMLAVPPLRGVARQFAHVRPAWVAAAVVVELGSCVGFVVIFRLFFDRVPAGVARELAWTEQGSGALLPGGGVGALAVGGWLLRSTGMSTRTIVERSSALFFLTSAVNVAALVVGGGLLLAYGPGSFELLRAGIPILGGLAATSAVLAIPMLVRRSPRRGWPVWLVDLSSGITRARRSLLRPSWRLLGAAGYLGFDIAALAATFAAAGHPLPVAPLVLGYLIGYLANLVPVPGGFGVLEGGLAGTLIAYGAPATQATAAVIIYHAIAFWIPSLGGLAGYTLLRRRLNEADRPGIAKRSRLQPCSFVPEPATAQYNGHGRVARRG
jgi:uncharacterized membrane protein YbhN (UPF0104 family)